jgi:hypothetical protein
MRERGRESKRTSEPNANHRNERGQATPVANPDALDRPGCSVPPLVNITTRMTICQTVTPGHLALSHTLFEEYGAWIGVDLSFQGFAAELAGLPGAKRPAP